MIVAKERCPQLSFRISLTSKVGVISYLQWGARKTPRLVNPVSLRITTCSWSPACRLPITNFQGKELRYYQLQAVNRTVEEVASGSDRALLVMAVMRSWDLSRDTRLDPDCGLAAA